VLIDPKHLRGQWGWILAFVLGLAAASVWFFWFSNGLAEWPTGSSWPCFVFGVVGGGICLFEFLLWPRKWFRAWRIGRTKVWMRAHVWLGLLCGPLLVYHSGFRLGGMLSAVLLILVIVVVVSGVYGLILQNILPRRMLSDLPSETIYSQIDHVSEQSAEEAERLVMATCGTAAGEVPSAREDADIKETAATGFVMVGAVRTVGRVQGKVVQTRVPTAPVPDSEPLREFFFASVKPFLLAGARGGSPLASRDEAAARFGSLKKQLAPEAHPTVEALESLCEQRRQFDAQKRMHFWLHSWLCVHLPLSMALIVLMFIHIIVALKYW